MRESYLNVFSLVPCDSTIYSDKELNPFKSFLSSLSQLQTNGSNTILNSTHSDDFREKASIPFSLQYTMNAFEINLYTSKTARLDW